MKYYFSSLQVQERFRGLTLVIDRSSTCTHSHAFLSFKPGCAQESPSDQQLPDRALCVGRA